jgi:PAS domain S-box-containing protein
LLSTILETLPIAVFGKNIKKDFQFCIWNKKTEEISGIKSRDCIGKYEQDFYSKEEVNHFRERDNECIRSQGVILIPEQYIETPTGKMIMKTLLTCIRDTEGHPSILLGITEDITEQKIMFEMKDLIQRIDQALALSENKEVLIHYVLFQVVNSGYWIFSDYFELDDDKQEMVCVDLMSRTPEEHHEFIEVTRTSKFKSGGGLPGRVMKSGQMSWIPKIELDEKCPRRSIALKVGIVGGLGIPITMKGKTVACLEFFASQTIKEITEISEQLTNIGQRIGQTLEKFTIQHELEIERIKSLKNAKLASLGEMSAGIAHEINNPLAIITSSIGLLSKFADNPEKLSSKIGTINKSCDRIARIVSGLRKFSRTSDKATFKDHELFSIIKEAVILIESKSKRHSTPVTIECSSQAHVLCDEVEIEQVLVNLINNAIDAVKNTSDKWGKVSLFDDADSVALRITDSGLGIPEDIRNKLFEPFFTTKKVGHGTGLGLSITKGILDEHKATINVLADSPHTCFEIRFPRLEVVKNPV